MNEHRQTAAADNEPAKWRVTQQQAADLTGASLRSVQRAARVAREAPDLVERVELGEMSLNAAEDELRRRPERDQPADWRVRKSIDRIVARVVIDSSVFDLLDELEDQEGGIPADDWDRWIAKIDETVSTLHMLRAALEKWQ